jgi:membrane protease YdiL (CAAX protease family)
MSDRPPATDDDAPRPMSAFTATAWVLGTTLLLNVFVQVMQSMRPSGTFDLLGACFCELAAYSLALFVILRVYAPDASIRSFMGLRNTHFAFYPLAVLLGLALKSPADALEHAILTRFPLVTDNPENADPLTEALQNSSQAKLFAVAVFVVVVGPMLEELLYRGALVRPMRRTQGPYAVAFVTGVLFALGHAQWQLLLPLGLMGFVLGVLRHESGTLIPGVLLHATFNAYPVVGILYAPGSEEWTPPPWLVAAASVAAVGLFWLVRLAGRSRSAAAARAAELP